MAVSGAIHLARLGPARLLLAPARIQANRISGCFLNSVLNCDRPLPRTQDAALPGDHVLCSYSREDACLFLLFTDCCCCAVLGCVSAHVFLNRRLLRPNTAAVFKSRKQEEHQHSSGVLLCLFRWFSHCRIFQGCFNCTLVRSQWPSASGAGQSCWVFQKTHIHQEVIHYHFSARFFRYKY